MVKKALCVGCNYPSKAFGLAGAVNDAFLIAGCLQEHMGFDPDNVCVLHDIYPGQKKSVKVEPARCPTRAVILQQLQWLVRGARPGDVLFFSFSGYGLQVDDLDGYEDEGYEEAILPTDFVDGCDGDYSVVTNSDIHDILMSVPPDCSATVLMDCDHATSVIDVTGTLDGQLVNGLKFQNFCGLKVHTNKKVLASHDREVWQEERARAAKARPRFQPPMEIENPRRGRLPARQAMARSSPVAFCFSAAGHGQTAMELQVPAVDGQSAAKQHGVLSWCFVQSLMELRHDCTYLELLHEIRQQACKVKDTSIPRLDQEVSLTFSTPRSLPCRMRVLRALEPQTAIVPYKKAAKAPLVVPPPPPGFISSPGAQSQEADAAARATRPNRPPGFLGGPGGGGAPQAEVAAYAAGPGRPPGPPGGGPPRSAPAAPRAAAPGPPASEELRATQHSALPLPPPARSTRAATFSQLGAPPPAPPAFGSPEPAPRDRANYGFSCPDQQPLPPPPPGEGASGGRRAASPQAQRWAPPQLPWGPGGQGLGHGLGQMPGKQAPLWTTSAHGFAGAATPWAAAVRQ